MLKLHLFFVVVAFGNSTQAQQKERSITTANTNFVHEAMDCVRKSVQVILLSILLSAF